MNGLECGKVIIVDDSLEEREALLNLFRIKGIATLAYSGKVAELPTSFLNQIRVVFADIELGNMSAGHNSKTRVGQIVKILNRIISEKNGPYILWAWTKHETDFEELVAGLKLKPVAGLKMHKSLCKNTNGKFSMKKIRLNMENSYETVKAYDLISSWEKAVSTSAAAAIAGICGSDGKTWEENNLKFLGRFAASTLEKQLEGSTSPQKYQAALKPFNSCLLDYLETSISGHRKAVAFDFSGDVDDAMKARINTALHISEIASNKPEPGNVYSKISARVNGSQNDFTTIANVPKFIADYAAEHPDRVGRKNNETKVKTEFETDFVQFVQETFAQFKLVALECSPICDFAQNKWINNILIPGIAIPLNKAKHMLNKEFLVSTPFINNPAFTEHPYKLVFDLRRMTTVETSKLKRKKPLLRLRREILSMIQVQLGQRVSRQGIVTI